MAVETFGDIGLYVHYPFCRRRCAYCDFNAYAGYGEAFRREYHRCLIADLRQSASQGAYRLRSVYIGGGTPSVMPPECLEELLDVCKSSFVFSADIEVSIEANPGTVSAENLRRWKQAGINRISFGVQSLDDGELRRMGRIHDRRTALESIGLARQAGFENISLDFIYGFPLQTADILANTLQTSLEAHPQHLSVYGLSVEAGTPLARALQAGEYALPDEAEDEALEDILLRTLDAAGYEHYEISNWCLPGFACRHNELYWQNRPYLGVGCGAVSYLKGWRFPRVRQPEEYMSLVRQGASPAEPGEKLEGEAQLLETWILGLRTAQGVDLAYLATRFGVDEKVLWQRWLAIPSELRREEGTKVRLTQRGWDVSNEVFVRFLI